MNLSKFSILDHDRVSRIPLKGNYSKKRLIETLINYWIPYVECHRKCSRAEYCKYNPKPYKEYKCPVAVDSLRNFMFAAFGIICKVDNVKKQNILDAAFYFTKFIRYSEFNVGSYMDKQYVESYKNYSPIIFGKLTSLRSDLESFAKCLKNIPEFLSKQNIIFVEGPSEESFLKEIKKSGINSLPDLEIFPYHGKGNRKIRRIEMLMQHFLDHGYVLYVQGDCDGKNSNIFKKLIDNKILSPDNVFLFEYDFETSIPFPLLYDALIQMHLLKNIKIDEFVKKMTPGESSVIGKLTKFFSIDLKSRKKKLAQTVGYLLNKNYRGWYSNHNFLEKTELGNFLKFIINIR